MKILLTVILLSSIIAAQNKYSIQPGVNNNKIVLELKNISTTEQTSLLKPLIRRGFKHLIFSDNIEETILLNPNEIKELGYYEVDFSATGGASQLTSGVYIYRLQSGSFVSTKKILVLK